MNRGKDNKTVPDKPLRQLPKNAAQEKYVLVSSSVIEVEQIALSLAIVELYVKIIDTQE